MDAGAWPVAVGAWLICGTWPVDVAWPSAGAWTGTWPGAIEEGQDHKRQAYLWNHRREKWRFWINTDGAVLVCAETWADTR